MHYVALSCRCLVGLIFLVSFAAKVTPNAFRVFVESLRAMKVVPAPFVPYWPFAFLGIATLWFGL